MVLFIFLALVSSKRRSQTNGMLKLALNAKRYYVRALAAGIRTDFEVPNLTKAQYKSGMIVPPYIIPYDTEQNNEVMQHFCSQDGRLAIDACTTMQVLMVRSKTQEKR